MTLPQQPPSPVTAIPGLGAGQVKKEQLEIVFSGEALEEIDRLRNELADVKNGTDVILKGLAVLVNARGKDMILKDRRTGISETITLWK